MGDERVVVVAKADPTMDLPVQSVVLRIEGQLPAPGSARGEPAANRWQTALIRAFRADAERIISAFDALPQGTLDQVLMLLLERRASLLRVRVVADKEGAQ